MSVSQIGFIRVASSIFGHRYHTSWYDDTDENGDFLYTILDDGEHRYPGTHRLEFDDGARSRRLTEALFERLRIQVAEPS